MIVLSVLARADQERTFSSQGIVLSPEGLQTVDGRQINIGANGVLLDPNGNPLTDENGNILTLNDFRNDNDNAPRARRTGGGGGGGGGASRGAAGGGGAGAVLGGVAQIIAATSPMVTAGIQASADKAMAGIQADAQIKQTAEVAGATIFNSQIQKDIAINDAKTAQAINTQNNDGVTERLGMQLKELSDVRKENFDLSREKLYMDDQYNKQLLALKWQEATAAYEYQKMALKAALVQSGFSSGFIQKDSSKPLSVAAGPSFGGTLGATLGTLSPRSTPIGRLLASLQKNPAPKVDANLIRGSFPGALVKPRVIHVDTVAVGQTPYVDSFESTLRSQKTSGHSGHSPN